MELSIWSSYYIDFSPEEAVERLLKNGICFTELSDEHGFALLQRDADVVKTGKCFAEFINQRNFEIPQGHLWLKIKLCSDENSIEGLCKWIDLYEAIGIKNMVLHCDNFVGIPICREKKIAKNVEKLRLIANYINEKDMTICLENLRPHNDEEKELIDRNAEDLLHIIELVGSDKFGICLDTGHLNLTDKNPREFILKAGKRLRALHIADNEGFADQHLMPFGRGNVDFKEVVKALREIGYNGIFNLEIPGERQIPPELRDEKIKFIKACYDYLMKL